MSNSEPSAIVLQVIPGMRGLYKFRFGRRKRLAQIACSLARVAEQNAGGIRKIVPSSSPLATPIVANTGTSRWALIAAVADDF